VLEGVWYAVVRVRFSELRADTMFWALLKFPR